MIFLFRNMALASIAVFGLTIHAAPPANPTPSATNAPLVINIDNPSFRKLVVALPSFITESNKGNLGNYAIRGGKELGDLLTFSGMFSVISESAYKELMDKVNVTIKRRGGIAQKTGAKGIEGVDVQQWKAVGVESLTVGEMTQDKDEFTISLRTLDLNRNEIMLGKQYTKVKEKEFTSVIRRYADLLLKAYTGKPGIFSSKLAFIGRRTKDAFKQVYISDFDGSNVVQITKGNAVHVSPAWSSDGRFLTYTSYKDGNPDIFLHEIATGKQVKIAGKKGVNSGSNWSPDNKVIAFSGSVGGDVDLYLVDAPSGARRRVFIGGSGLDVDPAFSPNAKHIAYVSGRFGNPHIFRADLEWKSPTEPKVIGEQRLTFAGWYNAVPAWSPTSDKIAFAGYDKDIDRWDVFTVDPDGKNMERLTLRTGDSENPSWSPNGQLLVFHSNRTNGQNVKSVAQLYVMNRDGSAQRLLSTGLYEARTPKWSNPIE